MTVIRHLLILVTVVFSLRLPSPAQAFDNAVYMAVVLPSSFRDDATEATSLTVLLYVLASNLKGVQPVTVERVYQWDLESKWKELRTKGYGYFIISRPNIHNWGYRLPFSIQVMIDVGSLRDTGIPFYGTLTRPIQVSDKGLFVKGPLTENPEALASELADRIRKIFPELGGSYQYYVNCFDSNYGEPVKGWLDARAQISLELWAQLRDSLAGRLRPLGTLKQEFFHRMCSSVSIMDLDPSRDADLLFSESLERLNGHSEKVIWQVTIQGQAQQRRTNLEGVAFPYGLRVSFQNQLRYWRHMLDGADDVAVFKQVCTDLQRAGDIDFAPQIAHELAKMVRMLYLDHEKYEPAPLWRCSL